MFPRRDRKTQKNRRGQQFSLSYVIIRFQAESARFFRVSFRQTNGGQAAGKQRRIKMTLLRPKLPTSLKLRRTSRRAGPSTPSTGSGQVRSGQANDRLLHRKDAVDAFGYVGQVGLLAAA